VIAARPLSCCGLSAEAALSSQCSLSPIVVESMFEDSRAVLGVAVASGRVYVVRADSPVVDVYSAVTWSLKRRLPVAGLRAPTDVAACETAAAGGAGVSVGCSLFVADWSECRIHRVVDVQACRRRGGGGGAAANGGGSSSKENWLNDDVTSTGWSTAERPWSLSLVEGRRHCTVLVTCDQVCLISV